MEKHFFSRVRGTGTLSLHGEQTYLWLPYLALWPLNADGKFSEVHLSQALLEYGLWQDYGTGKEVPRRNSGDLGRPKVRKERPGSVANTICLSWISRNSWATVSVGSSRASYRMRWTKRSSTGTIEKAKPSSLAFFYNSSLTSFAKLPSWYSKEMPCIMVWLIVS